LCCYHRRGANQEGFFSTFIFFEAMKLNPLGFFLHDANQEVFFGNSYFFESSEIKPYWFSLEEMFPKTEKLNSSRN